MSAPFEAVLFDFDGVLMDSEPVHYDCWRELLAPLGIELGWPEFSRKYIGVADPEMLRSIAEKAADGTTIGQLLELLPRKRRMFLDRISAAPPIAADLHAMLAALSHLRLAVVTSSDRSEVDPVLAAIGIRDRFVALVCGGDVARGKPSPDPYLKAAELLNVSTAIVVEDSDTGVASARAAGLEVIRVSGPEQVWPALRLRLGFQSEARLGRMDAIR